ncbi:MAG: alpha/beta hydrolase [Planctomycetes bacterium]|nr:alpha/beta hydrolase [Planctomycetota bacterium]
MFDDSSHFDSLDSYLEFYGLRFDEKVEHDFITFESGGYHLAGHIFKPDEHKAVVFVLHGFCDHCGLLGGVIEYLVSRGFAVVCFDMPGHGLSGGQRAGIDDFSEYSKALHDFENIVKSKLDGPYHVVGHSFGGAAVLDYLLVREGKAFERIVLIAPLVRSWLWKTSKAAFKLDHQFVEDIPRIFRRNSSDKEFLRFVKTVDPLRIQKLPLRWVEALYKWEEKITAAQPCGKAVKVIQGTSDTTVQWRFNIDFIQQKFAEVAVDMVEGGRHELFNESADIRTEVFSQISGWVQ